MKYLSRIKVLVTILMLMLASISPTLAEDNNLPPGINNWRSYSLAGQQAFNSGKYDEAEKFYKQALKEIEKIGVNDPRLATSLNNVAAVYHMQGKFDKAADLYKRVCSLREELLGASDPQTLNSIDALATLYMHKRKFGKAEELYTKALDIRIKAIGAQSPAVAMSLCQLGKLFQSQMEYNKAEQLFQRALDIRTKVFGEKHLMVAETYDLLGDLYILQDRVKQSSQAYRKAAGIIYANSPEADFYTKADGVTMPKITRLVKPVYPEIAKNNKIEGIIILSAIFHKDGTVTNGRVLHSLGYGCDEEALKALSKLKFEPATKDGEKVDVLGRLEFYFRLY